MVVVSSCALGLGCQWSFSSRMLLQYEQIGTHLISGQRQTGSGREDSVGTRACQVLPYPTIRAYPDCQTMDDLNNFISRGM